MSTALGFVACILIALSTDHDVARAMAIAVAALAVLVAVRTFLRASDEPARRLADRIADRQHGDDDGGHS